MQQGALISSPWVAIAATFIAVVAAAIFFIVFLRHTITVQTVGAAQAAEVIPEEVQEVRDIPAGQQLGLRRRNIAALRQRRNDAIEAAQLAQPAVTPSEETNATRTAELEEATRKAHEQAEYSKWCDNFQVEGTGEADATQEQASAILTARLLGEIQRRKVVLVESLAAELGVATSLAFDKIRLLEATGQLFGVMDDRGKYVAVTAANLQTLRDFVCVRGKASIHDVRKICASLLSNE